MWERITVSLVTRRTSVEPDQDDNFMGEFRS